MGALLSIERGDDLVPQAGTAAGCQVGGAAAQPLWHGAQFPHAVPRWLAAAAAPVPRPAASA